MEAYFSNQKMEMAWESVKGAIFVSFICFSLYTISSIWTGKIDIETRFLEIERDIQQEREERNPPKPQAKAKEPLIGVFKGTPQLPAAVQSRMNNQQRATELARIDPVTRFTPGLTTRRPLLSTPWLKPPKSTWRDMVPVHHAQAKVNIWATLYQHEISAALQIHGLADKESYVRALIGTESQYNPLATGADGEYGLMQLWPPTAKSMGLMADQYNPAKNIEAGTKYFKSLLDKFPNDLDRAISAYNVGPGRCEGGVALINPGYVGNVKRLAEQFKVKGGGN